MADKMLHIITILWLAVTAVYVNALFIKGVMRIWLNGALD